MNDENTPPDGPGSPVAASESPGEPRPRKAGTFTRENAAAAGRRSAAGRKKHKGAGLSRDVRRHRKVIVAGLLDLAENGSASAKVRALSELARIGWGSPASAAEMGAIDPVEGTSDVAGGAPYGRSHRGVVILPAEEDGELLARLQEIAKRGVDEKQHLDAVGLARLTPDERAQFEALQSKMRSEELPAPPAAQEEPVAPPVPPPPPARVFVLVPPHRPERDDWGAPTDEDHDRHRGDR